MWCPKCKSEYAKGIYKCKECDTDLVNNLPEENHEIDEPLAIIRNYIYLLDAQIAKSRLESEGVESSLVDENTISTNWLWSNALGGYKLQVKESEAEKADEILKHIPDTADGETAEKESIIGETHCPKCNSTNTHYERFSKKLVIFSWIF
ncbi:MAG: hypothetical protein ABH843_01935 [Candidatus Omnitrophota bacterium]